MSLQEQVLSDDRRGAAWAKERLLQRVQYLPEVDRAMMQIILSGRASQREIAAARKEQPGTICRRVRRLVVDGAFRNLGQLFRNGPRRRLEAGPVRAGF